MELDKIGFQRKALPLGILLDDDQSLKHRICFSERTCNSVRRNRSHGHDENVILFSTAVHFRPLIQPPKFEWHSNRKHRAFRPKIEANILMSADFFDISRQEKLFLFS